MTLAALVIVAFVIGWVGRDLWDFAVEMFELYREQR
jgi:flagellar biosynthesis protein FliQ